MWQIEEYRRVGKQLAAVPLDIQKRYEKWLDIAGLSGPLGLRAIRGFNDESLSGEWRGYRSSRVNVQYRVIYRFVAARQLFQVVEVTAHNYRKR